MIDFKSGDVASDLHQSLDDQVRSFEKGLIVDALTQARGVQVKAAEILGIKERSLWHRLKKHRIIAATFKNRS